MRGIRRHTNSLFEAIPALGTISSHGTGKAKLMPEGIGLPFLELQEGINRIGRDPGQNHNIVPSSHVSRSHCEVLLHEGKIWVRDLGSHNGTYINEVRINETKILKTGDRLGLSRRVIYVLVMDSELENPIDRVVQMEASKAAEGDAAAGKQVLPAGDSGQHGLPAPPGEEHQGAREAAPVAPAKPPGQAESSAEAVPAAPSPKPAPAPAEGGWVSLPTSHHAEMNGAESVPLDEGEPDLTSQLKQMEHQRNVLAILFQISLRCLVEEAAESEKLLINVLQRLVPLDLGFLLYQTPTSWQLIICPTAKERPSDELVKKIYHRVAQQKAPLLLSQPGDLEPLGFVEGSMMIVPMIFNDVLSGIIGTYSHSREAYGHEALDVMIQLANIATAALRSP